MIEIVRQLMGGSLVDEAGIPAGDIDWTELLHYLGDSLILPGFNTRANAALPKDAMPEDVSSFLGNVHELNTKRNLELVRFYQGLLSILNSAGIVPCPLKGVAMITTGPYDDIGERMLSDVDVLIYPHQLRTALECLRDHGFQQLGNIFDSANPVVVAEFRPLNPNDFRNSLLYSRNHVPVITDEDASFGIDLHVAGWHANTEAEMYLNSMAQASDRVVQCGSGKHRVSSDAFKLLKVFHASQLEDNLQLKGRVDWRHLIDAELLIRCTDHEDLMAECFERSAHMQVDAEFFTFLQQVKHYVAKDFSFDAFSTDARQKHALQFQSLMKNPSRQRITDLVVLYKRRAESFLPREVRLRHGPMPLPNAYGRVGKHLLHRLMARVKNRPDQ